MYNPISQFSNKLTNELLLFINNNIKEIKYEKYIFIVFFYYIQWCLLLFQYYSNDEYIKIQTDIINYIWNNKKNDCVSIGREIISFFKYIYNNLIIYIRLMTIVSKIPIIDEIFHDIYSINIIYRK